MDYYNYINQRQLAVHGHSSAANFAAGDSGVDFASARFSLSAAGGGSSGARYSDTGVLAVHCGTSTFTGGQRHLDGSAIANGKLSPGRDSASYVRPLTSVQESSSAADVDALTYVGSQRTAASMPVNNHHGEPATSTPLHTHHQPQRLRYLPPPSGTVLPSLDAADDNNEDDVAGTATEEVDDDGTGSLGDGRSSASSTRSSASGCRDPSATSPTNDGVQLAMKTNRKDVMKSEKTSTNTAAAAAAAAGLTSTQPLIYPWMRRVHSSHNGMHPS